MQRIDTRQAAGANRARDRRRQGFRPAMDMHNGAVARASGKKRRKRPCRGAVPDALPGCRKPRLAEKIVLSETDDFDAGRFQARIDRSHGGENDRIVTAFLKAERAVDRHFSLAAADVGVIEHDHYIERSIHFVTRVHEPVPAKPVGRMTWNACAMLNATHGNRGVSRRTGRRAWIDTGVRAK